MSAELLEKLRIQYQSFQHWSYQLHADNLKALVEMKPDLGTAPSYSTVLRRMKERGWYKKPSRRNKTPGQKTAQERLEQREVRSYESPTFMRCGIWIFIRHGEKWWIQTAGGTMHMPWPFSMTAPGLQSYPVVSG